jgi:ABC-type Co2+ transport system permease subunit
VVVIVMVIMVTALTRLFQFPAFLFCLPAMLAIPTHGPVQVFLGPVDLLFASSIATIIRPYCNRTGEETESDENCDEKLAP